MKFGFFLAVCALMAGLLPAQAFYNEPPGILPGYEMYRAGVCPPVAEPPPGAVFQRLFSEITRDLRGSVPPPEPRAETTIPRYIEEYKATFTIAGNEMEPPLAYFPPGTDAHLDEAVGAAEKNSLKMLGSVALGSLLLFGYYAATRRRDVET